MGFGNCSGLSVQQNPSQVSLSVSRPTVAGGGIVRFTPVGGKLPYHFLVVQGGGSVDDNGTYVAPNIPGVAKVRVTDSLNQTAEASVVIIGRG